MPAKKVGTVIREAREKAGISQDTLARKVTGVSAAELKRVEAGEADFTQTQLKAVAKALGVTQTSLLNAPKNVSAAKKTTTTVAKKTTTTTAKKTSSTTTAKKAGTTAAKKTGTTTTAKKTSTTAAKKTGTTTTAKKTSSTTAAAKKPATPKTPANANSTMKVTTTERKLIEYYRTASSDAKKAATKILKGEADDKIDSINGKDGVGSVVTNVVTDLLGNLLGGKREIEE